MKNLKVVAAIILKEGKVYATQRGYGEWKGWWEFPGGKVESGESMEDALQREIREELNVEISVDRYFCTVEYDYPDFHLSMYCYLCHIVQGTLTLLEHSNACWLVPDCLSDVKWLPADVDIIARLKEEM